MELFDAFIGIVVIYILSRFMICMFYRLFNNNLFMFYIHHSLFCVVSDTACGSHVGCLSGVGHYRYKGCCNFCQNHLCRLDLLFSIQWLSAVISISHCF